MLIFLTISSLCKSFVMKMIIIRIFTNLLCFKENLFNTFDINKHLIMAIKKQYLKSKPVCKVTFSISAKDAKKVVVAGDWNKWSAKAEPLKKLKNGTFKGTVDLDADKSYEFKYIVDGSYVNDDQADAYAWNEYASAENGVLKL